MRVLQKIWLGAVLLFLSTHISAYEPGTHAKISEAAVNASVIQQDTSLLKDLGIDPSQQFKNSNGDPRFISFLIQDGAEFEDDFPRSLNHFFNPLSNEPLTIAGIRVGNTSPDWALEDNGPINGIAGFGKQEFSYRDGRQYFYDALTKAGKSDRDKSFGLLFQTLGQVIHHVQDMAQPQHVRNDQHLELSDRQELGFCLTSPGLCAAYFAIKNPSLYEAFSNRNDVRPNLPFSGYPPVYSEADRTTFNSPRKFWTTTQSQGLAQFTNSNFVSAGTNFDNPGMFNFPLFDPAKRTDMDIRQLCAAATPPCPNPNLTGTVTFFGNNVQDAYTGQTTLNPFASSYSIFSADLTKIGRRPNFTLNRFNFALAHAFLIPRAVGYSAGLINYFFRSPNSRSPA